MQFIPAVDFHSINGKYSSRDTCTYTNIALLTYTRYLHATKYACAFTLGVCILFESVHSCISVDLSLPFVSSLFTSHKSLA